MALSYKSKPSYRALVLGRRATLIPLSSRSATEHPIRCWHERRVIGARARGGPESGGGGGGGETSSSPSDSNSFSREVTNLFQSLFQPKQKTEEGEKNIASVNIDSDEGLGGTSDGRFGPDAMLTVGFSSEENVLLKDMLLRMEADFVKLIQCDRSMLSQSLVNILTEYEENVCDTKKKKKQEEQSSVGGLAALKDVRMVGDLLQQQQQQQRTIFLSGMSGGEVSEVVNAYYELGLGDAAFAALVPNNQDSILSELVDEVCNDHRLYQQQEEERGRE